MISRRCCPWLAFVRNDDYRHPMALIPQVKIIHLFPNKHYSKKLGQFRPQPLTSSSSY